MGLCTGDFKVGDRVRLALPVPFDGVPPGTEGTVRQPSAYNSDYVFVEWDGYPTTLSHECSLMLPSEIELIPSPGEPDLAGYEAALWREATAPNADTSASEQPEVTTGSFELHGFGLRELLTYIEAFQDSNHGFKIEWTLSGQM